MERVVIVYDQTMMSMLHVTLNGAAGGVKGLGGLGIRDSSLRSE